MKKASSGCQFGNYANFEMLSLVYSFKLYICQDPRIARAYTAQNTNKKTHFLLASLRVYSRSRRGAERIRQGEGGWSRPPKTTLERSYLTEDSSFENRILRSRRKKTRDRISQETNYHSLYLCLLAFSSRQLRHSCSFSAFLLNVPSSFRERSPCTCTNI